MKNIYVSINTLKNNENKSIEKIIETYLYNGICNIELGSTNLYQSDIMSYVTKKNDEGKANFIFHNYFPPMEKPLVINLASCDISILKNSIQFIKNTIDYSSSLGCKLYSFHAGFRSDLTIDFTYNNSILEYETAYKIFKESIEEINQYANSKNVKISIENHQASEKAKNYVMFYSTTEYERLFKDITDDNIGVHLDVGHLKIAAKTFSFNPEDFIKSLKDKIFSLHLHDNNSAEDSHLKFNEKSWFVPMLKLLNKKTMFIIESHNQEIYEIKEQIKIIEESV